MDVTQPTVGRRIDQLEKRLGRRLFDRHPQGFTLTNFGREMREFVEAMDAEAARLANWIARPQAATRPRVVIKTTSGLAKYWLIAQLRAFLKGTTDIEIVLSTGGGAERGDDQAGDIVLRLGKPIDVHLLSRKVGQVACGMFASRDYLDTHGEPATIDDLARHRVIVANGEFGGLLKIAQRRALAKLDRANFSSDCILSQVEAAGEGLGIVAAPVVAAERESGLQRVLHDTFDVTLELWLLITPNLDDIGPVRQVADFITRAAAKDSERLLGRGTGASQ